MCQHTVLNTGPVAVKMDLRGPSLLLLLLDFLLLQGSSSPNRVAHFAINAATLSSNILQLVPALLKAIFCNLSSCTFESNILQAALHCVSSSISFAGADCKKLEHCNYQTVFGNIFFHYQSVRDVITPPRFIKLCCGFFLRILTSKGIFMSIKNTSELYQICDKFFYKSVWPPPPAYC